MKMLTIAIALVFTGANLFGLNALVFADQPSTILTPFYRSTQLQGHLVGMGLIKIPEYLLDPTIAFPYHKKGGANKEIPFVDTFTINRVMGGYPEQWLRPLKSFNRALGRASLDYVVTQPNGILLYRPELIRERLQPYLAAGYKPSDITLALDNVPWDLTTLGGGAPQSGIYGRKTPPGNLAQWSAVVKHFAMDLRSYIGEDASAITFETGIEFNSRGNFDGSAQEFFRYYEATEKAIHAVLPSAAFNPGEFSGTGSCLSTETSCVYDTKAFMAFTRSNNMVPQVVPRSLQQLVDKGRPWPSLAAAAMKASYRRLGPVTSEIHQFGLLDEPFGSSLGLDPGPMQASWIFQTLMEMIISGHPARVFHWNTFEEVGNKFILNGTGFDLLVLDHYLGNRVIPLSTTPTTTTTSRTQSFSVALMGNSKTAIVISSYSPTPSEASHIVSLSLPAGMWSGVRAVRVVKLASGSDVLSLIKQDLAKAGNLRPQFVGCTFCLGSVLRMANNPDGARQMISSNWTHYETALRASLRWQAAGPSVQISDGMIRTLLVANEVLVMEPELHRGK